MKVTCFVSPRVNLFFAGRVLAGLYEQPNINVIIKLARWMKYENSLGIEVNGSRSVISERKHAVVKPFGSSIEVSRHPLFTWFEVPEIIHFVIAKKDALLPEHREQKCKVVSWKYPQFQTPPSASILFSVI